MVGAIADAGTRRNVCNALSVPQMLPALDQIAAAAAKKDEVASANKKKREKAQLEEDVDDDDEVIGTTDNMYSHSFLCGLDRNKYGIVKVILPAEIAKSRLFFTGVSQKKKKAGAE